MTLATDNARAFATAQEQAVTHARNSATRFAATLLGMRGDRAREQAVFVMASAVDRQARMSGCGEDADAVGQVDVARSNPATYDVFIRCDGSGRCVAPLHEHGCYADFDGTACSDPDDHEDGAE